MAIGRITGPMLQSNLERQGYDIAIDGNVAYFDVSNRRLGVSIANPQYTLDVYGNARVANLTILGNTISSNIGQIAITSNVLLSAGGVNSTSPYTGALKVAGGVGIANDLWIGGNIYADGIISNSAQLSIRDPLLFLSSNTTTPYNYEIGFYGHFTGGSLNVYQTSGLVRDHNDNTWTFFSNSPMPTGTTVTIGNGVILDTIKAGGANIANATPSTSTTTGALRVAGGAGIAGALYITNTGDVSANIGARFTSFNALDANVGAYHIYANANAATQATSINSINANVGTYQIYANANIGTLYLGNISTNANLGAYQNWVNVTIQTLDANVGAYHTYANANAATQATSINSINANVGTYQIYANANIGVLYLGNISTNANLGAYQIYANANAATQATSINSINANVGAYQIYANANAATQATSINSINANVGAYQIYANANAASQQTQINLIAELATYSNSNVAAYLPTYTGNISAGNITSTIYGNIHADTITTLNSDVISFPYTTAIKLPSGVNSERPGTPVAGQLRYNSQISTVEFYNGLSWVGVSNDGIDGQNFLGDGINYTYTLTNSSTTNGVLVSINGTVQQPGTAYTVLGDQITFAEIPQITDYIDVRFLGLAMVPVFDEILINSAAIALTAGANTVIDTFSTSEHRSAKYTISGTSAASVHMADVMVIQYGSTVLLNAYGILDSSANTVVYYAESDGFTVTVKANATVATSARIQKTYFIV